MRLDDVDVQSLGAAQGPARPPADQAMEQLHLLDAAMARYVADAQAQGGVLRHVASLDAKGHASVRLAQLPASHPFAHTRLTDNVVQFTTHRYRDNPMLVSPARRRRAFSPISCALPKR